MRKAARSKPGKGANKFNAKATTIDGRRFASAKEAKRYGELKLLVRAGEVDDLRLQVPIMLEGRDGPMLTRTGKQMRLTVDFVYTDLNTGLTVYEDSKGVPTRDYEVRRAAAGAMGVEVKET